ncbi:MAG: hypothetical protein ACYTFW_01380 [Planctomycetota bacterium]|jgi:hypothetical protein
MSVKFKPILTLTLAAFALQTATVAETLPPAIQWIPQDAVISLELSKPKDLLELLAGEKATAAVTALPIYKQQISTPKFQELLTMVNFIELTLDTDWRIGLAKLAGGGITLAVCPEDTVVVIVDAEDEDMLQRAHEFFLNIARQEAEKDGQPDRVASTQYQDVTAWTFNGKESHAIIGKRLVIANRPEGLKAVLELRAETMGTSLASNPTYQAAKRSAEPDDIATVFANLKPFLQLPNVTQLLEQQRNNPLAALSFAGIVEAIRDSNWLALELQIEDNTLVFQASVDGKKVAPTSPAAFALPKEPGEGALPNLSVPRRIAALTLYRDLHQFYAAKDDLFPMRTSGLIFFENMMGIFFSGRDLTEEVLAETKPEIRFVVAEQQYDPGIGTPQIKFPAVAAILRLRHPEEFDEVVEEAWQKAVGLINFTRGQQAQPGLIIDRPIHRETKFTVAYFSTSGIEDKTKLDQRFNLRPALAMPDEYIILSSTDGLARDLIDTLSREVEHPVKPCAQIHSMAEIDADQLASILEANRETLVRGNMVKKGNTQEEAEASTDMLIALVKFVERIKLTIGMHEDLSQARLEMKLNLQ